MKTLLLTLVLAAGVAALAIAADRKGAAEKPSKQAEARSTAMTKSKGVGRVEKSDAEWRKQLTPTQYRVLRQEGTEPAFTGAYWNEHRKGVFVCAGCGLEVFDSDHKFESGTGWPSYWRPSDPTHVAEKSDVTLGMVRTEVECARCGGHLGHVFDDGPAPTGLRYCINSAALDFVPEPK